MSTKAHVESLLYTPAEAARALKMSRSKVYQMIRAGEIPSVKIGDSRRVPVNELNAWISARTRGGDGSAPDA